MQFWMSGEIHQEVEETHRHARQAVEAALNARLGHVEYGAGVEKLAFIAMIAPDGQGFSGEVSRYHRKRRVLEFRLRIDFQAFRDADDHARESLLASALRRSLSFVASINVRDLELERLVFDFEQVAAERQWTLHQVSPEAA